MDYTIVFEITDEGFKSWSFSAFGLIFVFVGFILVRYHDKIPFQGPKEFRKPFSWFFFIFALLWTSTSFLSTWHDYSSGRKALESGKIELTEGVVYDFVPMPYEGHASESFKVNGKKFSYSDYRITAGFNNTSSHGGPIREGLEVKIWHIGNKILKLGIKTNT